MCQKDLIGVQRLKDEIIVKHTLIENNGKRYVRWRLVKPLETLLYFDDGTQMKVVVPENFYTDFASVPKVFWNVIPPYGTYTFAAIVHDYLYYSQITSKYIADKTFLLLMKDLGTNPFKRTVMYWAVRLFGGKYWEYYANVKKKKEGKINDIQSGKDPGSTK